MTPDLRDFVSTTLVQQLKLKDRTYHSFASANGMSRIPIPIHGVTTTFEYQNISGNHRFDVANLHGHDLIPGTPFLYQHEIIFRFNPSSYLLPTRRLHCLPTVVFVVVNETLRGVESMNFKS